MKIQQVNQYQNTYAYDSVENPSPPKDSLINLHESLKNKPEAYLSISKEGWTAFRKNLQDLGLATKYTDAKDIPLANTNEIAWEHYSSMGDLKSLTLKAGNYNIDDVMKAAMEAYESVYNNIVKAHEQGERQVSYSLTGTRTLTLEEDLAGLDEAFQMCLANLEGYITCQQTNKAFEHQSGSINFMHNHVQNDEYNQNDYNYFDKEYRDMAITMMQEAREEFLAFVKKEDYKQGAAVGIILSIVQNNDFFLKKTKELFS